MIVALLALVLVAFVMGAMAIGVILSGKTLRGSCGGVGSGDCACDAAGVPLDQRACQSRGLMREQDNAPVTLRR
ncbi:MAG: hypothetical protein MUD17_08970 [Gemmatimonadaceae bacterium]|jgi:hypothetical protein|nr:hypothetical protein [Gemmatimonadaceae bacterium]